MDDGIVKTAIGFGSLLPDYSCTQFKKKKEEKRSAKLPHVLLFVIKFMVMHAWSGLMDPQLQSDVMALVSCACQRKRLRYVEWKQGGNGRSTYLIL